MGFIHDSTSLHCTAPAREYLNQNFHIRWIVRRAIESWPSRSPHKNSLDYLLRWHLKTSDCKPIETEEESRDRVIVSCEVIRNAPGIIQRIWELMRRKAEACIIGFELVKVLKIIQIVFFNFNIIVRILYVR